MVITLSRSYVARLMQQMGMASRTRKKFVATTDSNHKNPVADNVLNREFAPSQLGKVWVSDITYIPVKGHWVYLTIILYHADRAVVGWRLSRDVNTDDTGVGARAHARGAVGRES